MDKNAQHPIKMSNFRTEVNIPPSPDKISHHSNILFIGSCFTENIGVWMKEFKFRVDINPFGINYNPASVARNIELLLERKKYIPDDLYHYNDLWFSFDHHSRFAHPDPAQCLLTINNRLESSAKNLTVTDFLIITFGTAWVYERKNTGTIVSNCHKVPAREFNRYLLSVNQIVQTYTGLIKRLNDLIPSLNIIFTVSPVRHWKDGAPLNMVSKSTLILAVHEIVSTYDCAEYFPAYELAMDDLRDYRFYNEDMIHPNNQMTAYIWKKFSETYFDPETINLIKELNSLQRALNHKAFYPSSKEHKHFITKQLEIIDGLQKKYPFLDFTSEKEYFKRQIPTNK